MPKAHIRSSGVEIVVRADNERSVEAVLLHVTTPESVAQLREVMWRSMRSWEPGREPAWASDLMDALNGVPQPAAHR
jgi:hypothetical protein